MAYSSFFTLFYGFSSVGRATVSKTVGREFEPFNPCFNKYKMFKKLKKFVKGFVNYCKACYDELAHKTTWPTGAKLTHSAVVVLSASIIIALIVFCMDTIFKTVMNGIYPN